jgi:cephalosporin hydroxylase
VSEHKPKVIVEIGSYMGGTLYVFCRSNPDAELIVSMDLPGGVFGGGCTSYLTRFFSEFVYDRPNSRLETIRDDSHSVRAEKSLENLLDGRSIDFLYIDADHTYDGACSDFRTYSKFVSLGGLIAFHDIYSPDPTYGVPRLWKELSGHYPTTEFSAAADSTMGIGLLTYTGPSSVCNPGA